MSLVAGTHLLSRLYGSSNEDSQKVTKYGDPIDQQLGDSCTIYKRSNRNYNDKPCLLQALSFLVSVPKLVGEFLRKKQVQSTHTLCSHSAHPGTSRHQSSQHTGFRLVASHGAAAHFHAANHLFGGVVGPGYLRLPVENTVMLPIFAQADQQIS